MNIKDVLKIWKDYTGNCKITLSGELLLKHVDKTQLLVLTTENRITVDKCIDDLKYQLPFFKIEKVESMAETTIKIFAYNVYVDEKRFLEKLRVILKKCIEELLESEKIEVSLSVFGTFQDLNEKLDFRYLNKQSLVEYKVIQKDSLGVIETFFTRKLRVYFGLAFLAFVLSYFIYELIILKNPLNLGNVLSIFPLTRSL